MFDANYKQLTCRIASVDYAAVDQRLPTLWSPTDLPANFKLFYGTLHSGCYNMSDAKKVTTASRTKDCHERTQSTATLATASGGERREQPRKTALGIDPSDSIQKQSRNPNYQGPVTRSKARGSHRGMTLTLREQVPKKVWEQMEAVGTRHD